MLSLKYGFIFNKLFMQRYGKVEPGTRGKPSRSRFRYARLRSGISVFFIGASLRSGFSFQAQKNAPGPKTHPLRCAYGNWEAEIGELLP
jgi:hypothetical protein